MPLESQPVQATLAVGRGGNQLKVTYYLTMPAEELGQRVTASLPTG